MSAHNNSVILI